MDKGNISECNFTIIKEDHVIVASSDSSKTANVSTAPLTSSSTNVNSTSAASSQAPTATPLLSSSPSQEPPTFQSVPFLSQTTIVLVAATVALTALLVLAFKKGCIAVEIVEEKDEETD